MIAVSFAHLPFTGNTAEAATRLASLLEADIIKLF
jgi:hypothetical protein